LSKKLENTIKAEKGAGHRITMSTLSYFSGLSFSLQFELAPQSFGFSLLDALRVLLLQLS
jgi:hypothetical protein